MASVGEPVSHVTTLGRKTKALAELIEQKTMVRDGRMLVVGCGSGWEAAVLAKELGTVVTGIDLNSAFDPIATQHADLRQGDATCLEFSDNQFDFVYSYHALEHIPNYRQALREMHRVLKNDGWYCIGTPNRSRIVGYLGSAQASYMDKMLWNIADWKARAVGKFRNEDGAHAGFSSHELASELSRVFSDAQEITLPYYLQVYENHRGVIGLSARMGLGKFIFPSVYFIGRK